MGVLRQKRVPSPAGGRSTTRAFSFVLALFIIGAPAAADPAPPAIDPSIGNVEVTLDLPKDKPYVGEMIMLRMRSFVRADIVLDEVRQPSLANFDTQQLGRDRPISAMVDGFQVAGIERDIAIFPQQSGRLVIEPFVRHVTIATADNNRATLDFASKRLFVDVQNENGVAGPDVWWLPAKSVTVTDNWSVAPDEIKPGTLARRTVSVEAVGITADRLPPPPKLLAPGTIAFKGPAERSTRITEDGPIARATYQWDIRPTSGSPAKLPPIHVAWYDTSERRMRDAAIPDLWIAYIGTMVHTSHEKAKTWSQIYFSTGPVVAGVAGFAWTAAFAGLLLTTRRRPRAGARRRAKLLRGLRRAARFRDETGFRDAIGLLTRDDPTRWAEIARAPLIKDRLDALDRARYARDGGTPPPLVPLAADISRLMAEEDATETRPSAALPSLDGPLAPQLSLSDRLRHRIV